MLTIRGYSKSRGVFFGILKGEELWKRDFMSLITAYEQVGKTFIIIPLIQIYLVCGYTPVIVVADVIILYKIIIYVFMFLVG
jgi:hypothetical protein